MEEKIFDGTFFHHLYQLKLSANRKMNGGMSGNRRSLLKGTSVEFADFREYIPGDDIRRIDWNAYGRLDKLFVKQFMQEQEGMYTVLLDTSASMEFGKKKKSICAQRVAGAMGYLALHNMDRVRLGLLDSSVHLYPSLTGEHSLHRFLQEIEGVQFRGKTDLYRGIRQIPFDRTGMTIVISDFMDNALTRESQESLEKSVRYLRYHKQDVLLIHVLAEEEISPKLDGTLELLDSETEQKVTVTMTYRLQQEYQRVLEGFQKEIRRIASYYQTCYISMTSSDDLAYVLHQGLEKGILE